jgi:hypothetical protein
MEARCPVQRLRLSGAHSRPNDSRWASQRIGVKAQQHQCGSTSVPSMIAPIVAPVDIGYDTRRREVGAAEPLARSDQGIIRMRWVYIRVRGDRSRLLTFIANSKIRAWQQ